MSGYDSHLIFNDLDKFDVKWVRKIHGIFSLNKNLVFIDSMQFMNSSLDKCVKDLSEEIFRYLVEEFGSENLELLKVSLRIHEQF